MNESQRKYEKKKEWKLDMLEEGTKENGKNYVQTNENRMIK